MQKISNVTQKNYLGKLLLYYILPLSSMCKIFKLWKQIFSCLPSKTELVNSLKIRILTRLLNAVILKRNE